MFDGEIQENAEQIYAPSSVNLTACGVYGRQNDTTNTCRGDYNMTESEVNLSSKYVKFDDPGDYGKPDSGGSDDSDSEDESSSRSRSSGEESESGSSEEDPSSFDVIDESSSSQDEKSSSSDAESSSSSSSSSSKGE